MKTEVTKHFNDYEKEEAWINSFSAKGWNLVACTPPNYVFEESSSGEYMYRIVLLENDANNPETISYIRFMEEMGIEHVQTFNRWAYFRKKVGEGTFEIYTDSDSRIRQYKHVARFYLGIWIAGLLVASSQVLPAVLSMMSGDILVAVNIVVMMLGFFITICAFRPWRRMIKKINDIE